MMREECAQINKNQITYNLLSNDTVKYYLIIHIVHHYTVREERVFYVTMLCIHQSKFLNLNDISLILAVINKKMAFYLKYSTHKR